MEEPFRLVGRRALPELCYALFRAGFRGALRSCLKRLSVFLSVDRDAEIVVLAVFGFVDVFCHEFP
jgi:hypothetical protein